MDILLFGTGASLGMAFALFIIKRRWAMAFLTLGILLSAGLMVDKLYP